MDAFTLFPVSFYPFWQSVGVGFYIPQLELYMSGVWVYVCIDLECSFGSREEMDGEERGGERDRREGMTQWGGAPESDRKSSEPMEYGPVD